MGENARGVIRICRDSGGRYNGLGTRLSCSKWQCSGLQRKTRSGNTCSATAICTGSIYQNGVPRGNHPQHCCI
ncbi:hypothetical protein PHYPO_G00108460 [Pangasianodon hypophthalmus]|uniref:Uncharacterized protein n=1 Tax=Pangasianodon hypophthalmus TaxID=310915 RepID=A0A5N5PZX8_PANHP|nr:hypothetical protein PHYPO_G00108460 [Pangasianodon hypophthalmus]